MGTNISSIDYAILALYFITMLGITFFTSRKVNNMTDFARGGSSGYGSFFLIATVASAFIGGGFTMGLAEKSFSAGLPYVIALFGFSLKEILVGLILAPKMKNFAGSLSVGEIMGKLYGKEARIFTGFLSMLVCGGIAGAQFSAFGYITNLLFGVSQATGAIIGACVVILYSASGGMRSVVANDVLHFCILIVGLPVVYFLASSQAGGYSNYINAQEYYLSSNVSYFMIVNLFISFFFGETLVPPYVQRLLIGKTESHTAFATTMSGLISIPFFVMIALMGIIAHYLNPSIDPHIAIPYLISEVMPIGLKGLAIAGMLAVLMSSADAFLNAAAVGATHDLINVVKNNNTNSISTSRVITIIVGIIGLCFAVSIKSALDILLQAYNFWTPMILVPLAAGIYGYRTTNLVFWGSAFAGIFTVSALNFANVDTYYIDYCIFGVIASATIFFSSEETQKM